eukprot:1298372-Rhodomonas_salina.2
MAENWRGSFQTDQAISAIHLRACYAMSGTDVAYGALSLCGRRAASPYGKSGTDVAYGATSGVYERTRQISLMRMSSPVLLHPEIQYKKQHFQDNLYQQAISETPTAYAPTNSPLRPSYAFSVKTLRTTVPTHSL